MLGFALDVNKYIALCCNARRTKSIHPSFLEPSAEETKVSDESGEGIIKGPNEGQRKREKGELGFRKTKNGESLVLTASGWY